MSPLPDSSQFARLAADLQAEPDEDVTARAIVSRLVGLVPDADRVSLTIRSRHSHQTLASSDPLADEADALQYLLGEGPCVEAAENNTLVRSDDVADDPRWPRWGPRARELGVGSLLSVQLLHQDVPQGALNLYSDEVGGFTDEDTLDLTLIYAVHAANALTAARTATNLSTALTSRHTIGMAQGIAMERWGLDEQQSFELLRRISQDGNMKLRDVATHLVLTRRLPDGTSRRPGA